MFSASADLADVQRAYTAGVKDYLVTPFDPVVLEQKLERLLSLNTTNDAETAPERRSQLGSMLNAWNR